MTHFICTTVLLFGIALASFTALANTNDQAILQQIKKDSRVIPFRLIQFGVRVPGINLTKLLRSIDNRIDIRVTDAQTMHAMNANGRIGARWECQGNSQKITFAREFWTEDYLLEIRSVLALHEHLECSGIYDHDYKTSLALWVLNQDIVQNYFTRNERRQISHGLQLASGGGIIGTGGAGDHGSIYIRAHMIQTQINELITKRDHAERQKNMAAILVYLSGMTLNLNWKPLPQ